MIKFIIHNLKHTVKFWSPKNLRSLFVKCGTELLIIFIIWEIFEDIVFPIVMILLGDHFNPMFYTLVPAGWIVCLHPIAVPAIWSCWKLLSKKDSQ